jgi:hypothetical protein
MPLRSTLALVALVGVLAGLKTDTTGSVPRTNPPPAQRLEVPDDPYVAVPAAQQRTSPAYRWAQDGFVSVQVNVDAQGNNIVGDAANEPSLAIDPTNRRNMVIGWRQFDTINNNFRQAGWAYTHNGGQSWTFPGRIEPGVFRSDPVLDSDSSGNFYYDSLTSSGGVFSCKVFRSYDHGVTWAAGTPAKGGDKNWMVIDRTNSVGAGFIYSFWTAWYSSCNGQFTRSTNGGNSFENCRNITGSPYWGSMAVGPDGELYIVGDGFIVCKSVNAKIAGQLPTFTSSNVDLGGTIIYGEGPNPDGLLGQAWVDVDRSGGPYHGYVYLLSSVQSGSNPCDIRFARSTNGGQSWSPASTLNQDGNNGAWHWFGALSVAPNGRLDVTWNDTRNNPGSYLSQVFHAHSDDGGSTWSANVAVSPAFDPHLGWPQQNKIGDYTHMRSANAGAHLAYSATFNGEQDVYCLYIPRYPLGDVDCSGGVDFDDINPFVLALSGPAEYAAAYPNCDLALADANDDGAVDFDDINPFVALLSGQ